MGRAGTTLYGGPEWGLSGYRRCDPADAKKGLNYFRINRDCFSYRLVQRLITFNLVDISWLFFRADGLRTGVWMLRRVIQYFELSALLDGTLLTLGLDGKNFVVAL